MEPLALASLAFVVGGTMAGCITYVVTTRTTLSEHVKQCIDLRLRSERESERRFTAIDHKLDHQSAQLDTLAADVARLQGARG